MELPTSHRLPLSWLLEAASSPIQYRAYAEVVPASARDPVQLESLRVAALQYKPAQAIARRQRGNGLWGGNLLALESHGASDPGTVVQYRRLLELGWPPDERPFRVADRYFFRLLFSGMRIRRS